MLTVAIQGIAGSFHDQAAHDMYGGAISLVECSTFREVFEAVKNGAADKGVVAIENSLQGSINSVYRLLAEGGVWVEHEHYIRVEQFLIGARACRVSSINNDSVEILSHPVALVQVEQWLGTHAPLAHKVENSDTALAVKQVCAAGSTHQFAVAGKAAAELYGGVIIAGPINDDIHNYTRFFGLATTQPVTDSLQKSTPRPAQRTSIILQTSHNAGALYAALGAFAKNGVSLSKLDSHPIAGDTFSYAFYVDFDESPTSVVGLSILQEISQQGCSVRILGSYPAESLPL